MQEKICSLCKVSKPLEDFYKESRVKDGRARRCKKCHGEKTERYRKENPEVYRKASLRHWHKSDIKKRQAQWIKRYGITLEQYEEMYDNQKGVCKICKNTCSSRQCLSVDHCHKTGKVRGLLCVKCNTALGMLNDDVHKFKTAIEYLNQHAM